MRSELAAFGEMASHLANPLVLIGFALLLFFGVHRALLRSGILPPVDRKTSGVIVQSLLRYGFWIAALLIVLGIGYAGYKTYRETQPGIATAETVSKAIEALTEQLRSKDLQVQEYQDQNKALTETVQALAKKQDTPGVQEALAALAQGQTQAAKAIFAKTVEAKMPPKEPPRIAKPPRRRGTSGPWPFWTTPRRRCAGIDGPSSSIRRTRTGGIGWVISINGPGSSTRRKTAYRKVVTLGEANGDMEVIAMGTGNLGVIYQTRGELDRAEEMHKKALAIETRSSAARRAWRQEQRLRQPRDHLPDARRARPGRGDASRRSLAIDEKLGRQEGMASHYGNLGRPLPDARRSRPGRGDAQEVAGALQGDRWQRPG